MSNMEQTQAKARIESLVDESSFVEIGARVSARSTDFDVYQNDVDGDGVVCGYATVEGKLVFVYSQDASVYGGAVGEMHAKKIVRLYEMAMKMGAPVVGLVDCAGLRLEEVTDALNGFGEMYRAQAMASGVIPEIMAIFGKCGGGMAVAAGLADFVMMEEKKASLYVNAPNTLDGNYKEKCDTASAAYQSENTGLVDLAGSEEDILAKIRELVAILPANNDDMAAVDGTDDLNRLTENLEGVKDARDIAKVIADNYVFVETKAAYAKDVVTGFVRLDGVTVGVVGNAEDKLSADGCEKAASFVTFCDAFEIPVLTLTAVTGYQSDIENEKRLAKAASRLTYSFANASVPKINVVFGDSFGSAYVAMNSKSIGCDIVYAMEDVKIGMMDEKMAAKIVAKDPADINDTAARFAEKQTAVASARRGYVDEIVTAATLRKNVLIALEMLFNKREDQPYKKHSTK